MKLISNAGIELTERNLETLLKKLRYNREHPEEHPSYCTLVAPGADFFVRAVENSAHYNDRQAGDVLNNETGELE